MNAPLASDARVRVAAATVTQATSVAVLGISRKKFIALVKGGRLPHVRDGRLFIVRLGVLLAALEEHEVRSGVAANDGAVKLDALLVELAAKRRHGRRQPRAVGARG